MSLALAERPKTRLPLEAWHSPEPPVRVTRPMLLQAWRDCAFLHWSFEPSALLRSIPRGFELDTFDGRAWASLIAFRIPWMRAAPLPELPGLRTAVESHLRIYVRGPDGRRGIWMVSLDLAPLAGAALGRFAFALPYWWTSMQVRRRPDSARFHVRRRLSRPARLDLELEVGDPIPREALDERDHFLTARWVLYGGAGRVRTAILTQHPPWSFRRNSIRHLEQSVLEADGLPAVGAPELVHFSDGVNARLGWPQPLLVPASA